jgi:hypothetical protein
MVPQYSVRVVETVGCTSLADPVLLPPTLAMANGKWHTVAIKMKAGQLDLSIDTVQIANGPVKSSRAVDGYWGFTAATGANSGESHEIRAVKMTLTNQPLCTR